LVFVLPPWGWSTGFFATPLTEGLNPFFIFIPALPIHIPLGNILEFLPNIIYELSKIILYFFDGILTVQWPFSMLKRSNIQKVPADLQNHEKIL
jgi:hypothetical protein